MFTKKKSVLIFCMDVALISYAKKLQAEKEEHGYKTELIDVPEIKDGRIVLPAMGLFLREFPYVEEDPVLHCPLSFLCESQQVIYIHSGDLPRSDEMPESFHREGLFLVYCAKKLGIEITEIVSDGKTAKESVMETPEYLWLKKEYDKYVAFKKQSLSETKSVRLQGDFESSGIWDPIEISPDHIDLNLDLSWKLADLADRWYPLGDQAFGFQKSYDEETFERLCREYCIDEEELAVEIQAYLGDRIVVSIYRDREIPISEWMSKPLSERRGKNWFC